MVTPVSKVRPPNNNDPGSIGTWKRIVSDELIAKIGELACFVVTGKPFERRLPKTAKEIADKNNLDFLNNSFDNVVNDQKLNKFESDSKIKQSGEIKVKYKNEKIDFNMEKSDFDDDIDDDEDDAENDALNHDDDAYSEWENIALTLDEASRQTIYLSQVKHYLSKVNEDKETYKTVYGMIWKRRNLEAQQLLEQQKGFHDITIICDAIKLWNLISKTFLRMDDYNNEDLASFNYERFYHEKLSMNQHETVSSFKERFMDCLNGFSRHGLTQSSSTQAALHFINKLDERDMLNLRKNI